MMVLLSQKEYNDLLKRCGNADILAEEKLDILKKALLKELGLLIREPLNPMYKSSDNIEYTVKHLIKILSS